MDRTLRAALVAALFGLVVVGGMAWFLGLTTSTALGSGVVAAVLFGGLILLVARRADGFDARPGPDTPSVIAPDEPPRA